MQKQETTIKNSFGEKLDTWVETPSGRILATVVMVHGFGTNKHETASYFDDVSSALTANNYRVVRFDFSGYGQSEGNQEDACYSKHVGDLVSVLDFVKASYTEPLYIFAQSMGCFVTAITSPTGIKKTLMTGLPNANTKFIIDRLIARFGSRPGAKLDLGGVSELPRSTGKMQKLGRKFWEDITNLDPLKVIEAYAKKTNLLVIHWNSDEILGKEYLLDYEVLENVQARWLPGDHSVQDHADRANFINVMLDFYTQ